MAPKARKRRLYAKSLEAFKQHEVVFVCFRNWW